MAQALDGRSPVKRDANLSRAAASANVRAKLEQVWPPQLQRSSGTHGGANIKLNGAIFDALDFSFASL
jgi:hypothetical protein